MPELSPEGTLQDTPEREVRETPPYSKETVDLIMKNVRVGLKRSECYVGIVNKKTFYKWLHERPEFAEAMDLAELETKRRALLILHKGMEQDAKWSAWWLERRHRGEYAKRIEMTGADGGPVQFAWAETDDHGKDGDHPVQPASVGEGVPPEQGPVPGPQLAPPGAEDHGGAERPPA